MEITFKKVHTVKDLAISTIVLLSGFGFFFVNKGLGITIAVCGLAMFFIYKSGYRKDGQGIVLQKRSEDLCKTCKASIMDSLAGRDVNPVIKKGNDGGSIRLDLYYNRAGSIAYAQLFEFRNYAYEPVTGIVELKGNIAEKLIMSIR